MAITNHQRVGKALDLLTNGLPAFAEREMRAVRGGRGAISSPAHGKRLRSRAVPSAPQFTVRDVFHDGCAVAVPQHDRVVHLDAGGGG